MIFDRITDALTSVQDRIAGACSQAGRPAAEVRLVAVTKRIDLAAVVAACRAGQWDLGENRIQDALPRQVQLASLLADAGLPPGNVRWHFIGHLQRNKAGKAVGSFCLLHAVDSWRLAEKIEARAAREGHRQPVLIEVNVAGEAQKHGVTPDETVPLAARLCKLSHLALQGLMTMGRYGASEAELRRTFVVLRRLREDAGRETGLPLPELSMGMSGDFEAAVLEGATIVRVGTAIFGPRTPA